MDKQYRISMRVNLRSRKPIPVRTGSQTPASGFSRNRLRLVLRCAVLVVCLFAFSAFYNPFGFSQDKKQKPKPTETKQKKETKPQAKPKTKTKQKTKPEPKQKKKKPKPLPVEKLITNDALEKLWHFHSAEKKALVANTWKMVPENGNGSLMLKCLGKPNGYLRTKKQYENYVLEMEFRYPGTNKNCNSGILLHCTQQDKIWPGSIQIQLHYPKFGNIFPIQPAKNQNVVNKIFPKPPLNQWIKLKIESENGKITLSINNTVHGIVNGCNPKRGFIALQSEGSEIHFKNITIKELPATKPVKKKKKQ